MSSTNVQDSTTIGVSTAGLGFQSICLAGGAAFIYNSQPNSIAIGNTLELAGPTGAEGISIGHNSGIGNVGQAIAIGVGAVNNQDHSCLIGDSGILNIRPNSSVCTLGTASAPFKALFAGGGGSARTTLFSQYSSITLSNSTTETSIVTGTHVGSLILAAGQTAGTVLDFHILLNAAVSVGTLTFNFKVNGTTVLSNGYTSGDLTDLRATFAITSSDLRGYANITANGVPAALSSDTAIAYDKSVQNTWNVTAVFSNADPGNTLSVDIVTVDVLAAT